MPPTDQNLFLAYVAGFFDGEGCVSILKYRQKNRHSPSYRLHAHIVQKSLSPLDIIHSGIGVGNIFKMTGGFQLQITGIESRDFLEKILPYLILKKEQAILGIEYYDTTKRDDRCDALNKHPHPITGSIVILTVAHLGIPKRNGEAGNKHDKMDVRRRNLKAMCQRCHLIFDLPEHVQNAKATRRRRLLRAGQLEFPI